jgi:arginyl-tRNA synthetase
MAGIMYSGKHTQVLHEIPGKSDHFVGACYASYIKSRAQAQDDPVEDSLDRESVMHDDSADAIVNGVLAGDPHVLQLWSKTRAWVLAGHRKTLARLGIEFDRVIFESDFLDEMSELGESGIASGALERRDDGVVIYRTGRSELEEMPLVRPDGVSTQHMRALAYWTVAPELDAMTSIQVCGGEWVSHVTCRQDLMERLADQQAIEQHPTHTVFHGLVAEGGQRLSSSQEGASLIDELIETLDAAIDADDERRAIRDRLPAPDALGAQVALGYFLLQQTGKAVDFDPSELLDDGRSLAWDIARARVHPVAPADGSDPVEDPDYRFAVVQSELFRVHLAGSIDKLDVTPLARHAAHLTRWYVEQPRRPEVAELVQIALDEIERALGLTVGR